MSITDHRNVKEIIQEEEVNEEVLDTEQTIRDRIHHVLTIYPRISTSMLQIGVGTSLMPALWKPILDRMIREGIVLQERQTHRTPTDRMQVYTILSLADKE